MSWDIGNVNSSSLTSGKLPKASGPGALTDSKISEVTVGAGLVNNGPGTLITPANGFSCLAITPSSTGDPTIELDGIGASNYPYMTMTCANGTKAALTATVNTDQIFELDFYGRGATTYKAGGSFTVFAEENFDDTHSAMSLHWSTMNTSEAFAERFSIDAQGNTNINNGSLKLGASGVAGGIVRQISAGGALTVSASVTAQATPSNPSGTTDTTGKMMGLTGAITPTTSGKVLITISGTMSNNTINDGTSAQIRYGTGTAPTNGAALTGTAIGGKVRSNGAAAAQLIPFSVQAIVSGLTLATAIWIDLGVAAITGGTASVADISISAVEL